MNRKKQEALSSPPAVGGISLLVVFAVLCLTVFALLSLTTVRADDRVGAATAEAVSKYYDADRQAQVILARLRSGKTPEGVTRNGDVYTYQCPISDTQALAVEVSLEYNTFSVLRWEAVSNGKWEADRDMHLWQSTEEN